MKVEAHYDPDTGTLKVDLSTAPDVIQILYNEEQIAEMFGVTIHTVRFWRKQNFISFIAANRTVRFTTKQIEEFIERNSVPATRAMDAPTKAAGHLNTALVS